MAWVFPDLAIAGPADRRREHRLVSVPSGYVGHMEIAVEQPPGVFRPRGPDRRRQRRFIFLDRRSGFDRRRREGRSPVSSAVEARLLSLRDQPRLLAETLVLVNLLSMLDLLLTLWVLRLGAIELNPIMDWLFEIGPAHAAVAKIGVMALATFGLWSLRRYRKALTTTVLLLAGYGALVTFEIIGLVGML